MQCVIILCNFKHKKVWYINYISNIKITLSLLILRKPIFINWKYFLFFFKVNNTLKLILLMSVLASGIFLMGKTLVAPWQGLFLNWPHISLVLLLKEDDILFQILANLLPLRSVSFLIKEGNVLFNDTLNTFYVRLYGVRHMVKDHSDSEKGNPLPPHRLLFSISSKGSFICTIPQTG